MADATATATVEAPETTTVEKDALSTIEKANAIKVSDQPTYDSACEMLKAVKQTRNKVAESFDPIIESAHRAHKTALEQKNKLDNPLKLAEQYLKGQVGNYALEQERIRKAEEERQRKIQEQEAIEAQRKQEEEDRLNAAIEAESAGNTAVAEEIINAPAPPPAAVYVPPVVLPSTVKKVAGISSRETWQFEVTNLMELVKAVASGRVPITALEANSSFLGQQARSMKGLLNYPGVRVFNQASTTVRG